MTDNTMLIVGAEVLKVFEGRIRLIETQRHPDGTFRDYWEGQMRATQYLMNRVNETLDTLIKERAAAKMLELSFTEGG